MLGQQPEANVPGDPRYLITVRQQIPQVSFNDPQEGM